MAERKAKWQNNYIAKTYDRINLTVPKGEKEMIKNHADKHDGGSVIMVPRKWTTSSKLIVNMVR